MTDKSSRDLYAKFADTSDEEYEFLIESLPVQKVALAAMGAFDSSAIADICGADIDIAELCAVTVDGGSATERALVYCGVCLYCGSEPPAHLFKDGRVPFSGFLDAQFMLDIPLRRRILALVDPNPPELDSDAAFDFADALDTAVHLIDDLKGEDLREQRLLGTVNGLLDAAHMNAIAEGNTTAAMLRYASSIAKTIDSDLAAAIEDAARKACAVRLRG